MKTIFSRIVPFLVATLVFPVFIAAQDDQTGQEAPVKYRSDAEIIAGLEVYAANLDKAYVDMRDERDALRERVAELEEELEAAKASQEN